MVWIAIQFCYQKFVLAGGRSVCSFVALEDRICLDRWKTSWFFVGSTAVRCCVKITSRMPFRSIFSTKKKGVRNICFSNGVFSNHRSSRPEVSTCDCLDTIVCTVVNKFSVELSMYGSIVNTNDVERKPDVSVDIMAKELMQLLQKMPTILFGFQGKESPILSDHISLGYRTTIMARIRHGWHRFFAWSSHVLPVVSSPCVAFSGSLAALQFCFVRLDIVHIISFCCSFGRLCAKKNSTVCSMRSFFCGPNKGVVKRQNHRICPGKHAAVLLKWWGRFYVVVLSFGVLVGVCIWFSVFQLQKTCRRKHTAIKIMPRYSGCVEGRLSCSDVQPCFC